MVLHQGQCSRPLASVHRAPDQRGPRIVEEVGVPDKDKKKIQNHLAAIRILKERDVKGSGIISAYHTWRVAPLMRRVLPLYTMVAEASLDGTVLAEGVLSPSEVAQRIKEAMEPTKDSAGAILDFVCWGIPHCGRNRGSLTS